MLEKILQKLKAQKKALEEERGNPSHVSDRSIDALGKVLESIITTDDVLAKFDFTSAFESLDGNINKISKEAVLAVDKKTKKLKKTEKEDDKKIEEVILDSDKKKVEKDNKDDELKAYIKSIADAQKKVLDRLDGMEADKTVSRRKARLQKALNDTPDFYSKTMLTSFDKMQFEDDDEFEEYLSIAKVNKKEFIQQASENGLKVTLPEVNAEQQEDDMGQTEELSSARDLIKKANESKKD